MNYDTEFAHILSPTLRITIMICTHPLGHNNEYAHILAPALVIIYSSNEVLHHLDFFFIFLSDMLTNNFKPSFLKLHSLKEFDNVCDKTKNRCGNDFRKH